MAYPDKRGIQKYREYSVASKHGIICHRHHNNGTYPLHRHDYIEFEFLVTGTLEHTLNGSKQTAKVGSFWCLGTEDIHAIATDGKTELHNICIDPSEAPAAVTQFLERLTFPLTGTLDTAERLFADTLFNNLTACLDNDPPYAAEKVTGYLLLLLTHLTEHSQPADSRPIAGYSRVADAVRYITDNFAKPLSLAEVAATVYLTPAYFSALFADVTGYTFTDYVTYVRLQKAKTLLRETALPVTFIAFECGFGSFSAFSRAFRQQNSCTPTAYRKKVLHKARRYDTLFSTKE